MRIAAPATSTSAGPTGERGAPGPAATARGAGSRPYQSASAASPIAEVTYCRTWQTVPWYPAKLTGALSTATRRTIQPSLWVDASQSRWVHTPITIDTDASAHSSGRPLKGASARRHRKRARGDSSAVSGRRSRYTASSAAYPRARQVVSEPVRLCVSGRDRKSVVEGKGVGTCALRICAHPPTTTDTAARAHAGGPPRKGGSARRHRKRARGDSSAVSGRRSRYTASSAAYPRARQVVSEPVRLCVSG